MVDKLKFFLIFLITGWLILSCSSCGSSPSPNSSDSSPSPPSPSSPRLQPSPGAESTSAAPSQTGNSLNPPTLTPAPSIPTVSATIYQVDSQCQELVPEEIQVAGDRPMDAAIGKVIEAQRNADFDLAGYRITVANQVATVDLRLIPKAQRQMESLSSCEQLGLFGSIEETLIKNPQWNIKSVKFTERGQEIQL